MNKLLAGLIVGFFAVSVNAIAADTPPKVDGGKQQEIFTKMKQMHVDGIQSRIDVLQTALSCVNAATGHDQMKQCNEQEHKATEAFHDKQKVAMESMETEGGKK